MMKKVLVAVLDWGLGHASRSIPVIRLLLDRKAEVVLAGSGESLIFLQSEFPTLRSYELPAYNPSYPTKGSMALKMALQLPKFVRAIVSEHAEVNRIVEAEEISLVISDNRFGCWSSQVPSIFITHQSNIMMPKRFGWLQGLVRHFNVRQMKKFSLCWIPDFPDGNSLADGLASFEKIEGVKREYIGPLSRFRFSGSSGYRYKVAAIISGPEPQRTLLENVLSSQLEKSGLPHFIVRGKPHNGKAIVTDRSADFLNTGALQKVIEDSEIIIARSGYSTIMDLQALRKKAVFIPTPGQTEQNYLASLLQKKGIAFSMSQDSFDVHTALQESERFSGFTNEEISDELLIRAVDNALSTQKNVA